MKHQNNFVVNLRHVMFIIDIKHLLTMQFKSVMVAQNLRLIHNLNKDFCIFKTKHLMTKIKKKHLLLRNCVIYIKYIIIRNIKLMFRMVFYYEIVKSSKSLAY